ncbi:D-lactate dehydrogenase [Desulfomicrobium macestii]|uniref:D-lactate dehydrogenase (cytochrome) n=1 Tax=Desulfomicrobium macestii TaxID=90731 RepID=A0ABR9H266_9BACT|nr:FAD-binding and (Fe-S)-binding domain-containing protein [Desulfomicrobium macestii]MBE1424796.1 D-lactate dehydrogenase [Desulfomicrobium macestii]
MPLPSSLAAALARIVPAERLYPDAVRARVFALDASIYQPRAKAVIDLENETEIRNLLATLREHGGGVTFRGAGTSLNGQATGEEIVARIRGPFWRRHEILDEGRAIRLHCGLTGGEADAALAPLGRRIGPDPASASAASIGGMVANNAAGMCCTVDQNTFATMRHMRLILADGTILDTEDPDSVAALRISHAHVLERLLALRGRIMADPAMVERIRRKYSIKNTTGYAINALTEYGDPLDMLTHLMIGSEGTLGFVSSVTLATVPVHPLRATALMIFPDLNAAARAVMALRGGCPVQAAELLDRTSIRAVEGLPSAPPILRKLGDEACAVLMETRAEDSDTLARNTEAILAALVDIEQVIPPRFTTDPAECERLWAVRRGLFSAVTSFRAADEFVITEDINIPVERLAEGCAAFQRLFKRHGYDAGIMGHAFHGNFHFTLPTRISDPAELRRLHEFLDDLATLITQDFDGSLKAEHGTGRAIAPYVRQEWGDPIHAIMREIKKLLDPHGILNPGVMFNEDPSAHLEGLKLPLTSHQKIDMCVDCGFCEPVCPSRHIAFTPRQRIAAWREITRLEQDGRDDEARQWREAFTELGESTCATDGLCTTRCPLSIDVASFIRDLRHEAATPLTRTAAARVATHFNTATSLVRGVLGAADLAHLALGDLKMEAVSRILTRLSGNRLPLWQKHLPRAAVSIAGKPGCATDRDVVVYLPSCATRTMGDTRGDRLPPLPEVTRLLLERAGFTVRIPGNVNELCCGKAFETKGLFDQAQSKILELERALREASENGRHPILCDTSPCLARMKKEIRGLALFEPIEFAQTFLLPRLQLKPARRTIALHPTCSTRLMGLTDAFTDLAHRLAASVVLPEGILCCGFSGDKGFHRPDLNASALAGLAAQVAQCGEGYSTSRTCEIGLSLHGGIPYRNILYLLEECSRPDE